MYFFVYFKIDKKQFWLRGGNFHYHHGMSAGENTLDALVTRLLTQSIIKQGVIDTDDYRNRYISFLTTPGSHNDTYAGTCHRMFFKNLRDGVPPKDCPDNDTHNVDAIDALMVLPPVILANIHNSEVVRSNAIKDAIQTTRKSQVVLKYATLYSNMLLSILLEGATMQEVAVKAGSALGYDVAAQVRKSNGDPMVACYIDSSFPALLQFVYKYGEQGLEPLLLASTNAGGENVGRGSLLGALAGARYGKSAIPNTLLDGLVLSNELQAESTQFAEKFA